MARAEDPRQRSDSSNWPREVTPEGRLRDGQPGFPPRTDPQVRKLGFTGPISGGRHQFMKNGPLNGPLKGV